MLEVRRVEEDQRIRGRIGDHRWISLAAIGGDAFWAQRISLVPQLMELGFSDKQAQEAAKRCSTVEGAVEYMEYMSRDATV